MLASEKFISSFLKKNKKTPLYDDWNHNLSFSYEEYITKLDFINNSRNQLQLLKKNKGIAQRTEEWYNIRTNMITASDTYGAIKEYKSLIKNKALQINLKLSSNALRWGVLFEPIASKIYSILNNKIKIYEFGLLVYDEYKHFGASPDGISELGIMLEIKCPLSREIKKGDIPIKYYAQMQGQMAVCNLQACDYAEFAFEEIDVKTYLELDRFTYCGIIIENEDGTVKYSKLLEDPNICYMQNINLDAKKTTYWRLKTYNIERVQFDKDLWYDDYLPKIKNFWKKVQEYEEPQYKYLDDSD